MRVLLSVLLAVIVTSSGAVPVMAEGGLRAKWRELFGPGKSATPPKQASPGRQPGAGNDARPSLADQAGSGGDPRIAWEVVNPFRFFNDARDTERHARAYAWLTDAEKRDPVLNIERKLAKRYPEGWAANMRGATCWDRQRNRHRCPDGGNYIHPKSHTVKAAVLGDVDLGDAQCAWQITTLKRSHRRRRTARAKVQRVSEPCNTEVTFQVPYPSGANVTVRARGRTIARQIIKVRDVFIVGMGDSFGSGEGNPDQPVRFSEKRTADYGSIGKRVVLTGFPARAGNWRKIGDKRFERNGARWLDQACHRSLYSHQLRAALQLAIEDPHRAVTFAGVACSGAEVTAGLFLRYKGNEWVPNPPDLSQISAVAQAQCGTRRAPTREYHEAYHMRGKVEALRGGLVLRKCPSRHARRIDLVFLSIGGNDIGFARLVANAVLRDKTLLRRLGGWFGQVYRPRDVGVPMSELTHRYRALDRALHNILHMPWNGRQGVVITAYPGMALLRDGRTVCPDGRLGMDILPQYSLSARRALDGEKVGDKLYRLIRTAADKRGWRVAASHRARFLGRGICAGASGLTAADELRLPRKVNGYWEPYNPANFEPYAERQRWFRTPNDAFMTAHFHVRGKVLSKLLGTRQLQWTQLLLASTYSGAFHPTAAGQAAMADAVVREARVLLGDARGG
ncbi:MAG: hypothetical protein ACR2PI_23920 [Hyphomicrobiaceae bacterium]